MKKIFLFYIMPLGATLTISARHLKKPMIAIPVTTRDGRHIILRVARNISDRQWLSILERNNYRI